MYISIQGKLLKVNEFWEASLPVLQLQVKEKQLLMCLDQIRQNIKNQLKAAHFTCKYTVADNNTFYLITLYHIEFVEYIATKVMKLEGETFCDEKIKQLISFQNSFEEEE